MIRFCAELLCISISRPIVSRRHYWRNVPHTRVWDESFKVLLHEHLSFFPTRCSVCCVGRLWGSPCCAVRAPLLYACYAGRGGTCDALALWSLGSPPTSRWSTDPANQPRPTFPPSYTHSTWYLPSCGDLHHWPAPHSVSIRLYWCPASSASSSLPTLAAVVSFIPSLAAYVTEPFLAAPLPAHLMLMTGVQQLQLPYKAHLE